MSSEDQLTDFLTVFATFGAVIYSVYALKALIETQPSDVSEICEKSNLWYYLATVLVATLINTHKELLDKIIKTTINIGLIFFGFHEFYGVSCAKELKHTLIYKLAFVYWIIFFILLVIIVLSFCLSCNISCCKLVYKSRREITRRSNDSLIRRSSDSLIRRSVDS